MTGGFCPYCRRGPLVAARTATTYRTVPAQRTVAVQLYLGTCPACHRGRFDGTHVLRKPKPTAKPAAEKR